MRWDWIRNAKAALLKKTKFSGRKPPKTCPDWDRAKNEMASSCWRQLSGPVAHGGGRPGWRDSETFRKTEEDIKRRKGKPAERTDLKRNKYVALWGALDISQCKSGHIWLDNSYEPGSSSHTGLSLNHWHTGFRIGLGFIKKKKKTHNNNKNTGRFSWIEELVPK